jgi:CubicO group peptidase (beta-lactamase class C family)
MRATILLLTLVSAAYAGSTPATTQTAATEDVSKQLEAIRQRRAVPAMAAAVLRGDMIVASGATGVRRRGGAERITLDDKFHIGSCTKAMTATLCAMLVEEGKLRWDSTLEEIFPDERERMRKEYRGVTLEQLLNHRSGMPAGIDVGDWYNRVLRKDLTPMQGRQIILRAVTAHEPDGAPGARWKYNNAGYAIAGHMAERVTGVPWEDLMRRRIFEPLGMSSAGFAAPGEKGNIDQPRGHGLVGLPVEPGPGSGSDNPAAMGPAGTVHCSIGDWAKFVALHLTRGASAPNLLKRETFDRLHKPVKATREDEIDYAMGWCVAESVLNHSGSNSFWYCEVWMFPQQNLAILVTCNQGDLLLAPGAVRTAVETLVKQYVKP